MPVGSEIRGYRRVPQSASLAIDQSQGTGPIAEEPIEQRFCYVSTLAVLSAVGALGFFGVVSGVLTLGTSGHSILPE